MNKLSKKLKIVLTASVALYISACACLPKTPVIKPKQIIQRLGVCKQYDIIFGDRMTFKYEKDIPIADCLIEGDFVLSDSEIIEIRNYYNEAKKCEKECKAN